MKRNWKEIERKWLVECFHCLWNASIACRMCLLHAGCFYCLWNVSVACGMCLSLISLRDSRQYTFFQLSHPFHLVHTERKWKENERKWKGNGRKWKVDERKSKGKWKEGGWSNFLIFLFFGIFSGGSGRFQFRSALVLFGSSSGRFHLQTVSDVGML